MSEVSRVCGMFIKLSSRRAIIVSQALISGVITILGSFISSCSPQDVKIQLNNQLMHQYKIIMIAASTASAAAIRPYLSFIFFANVLSYSSLRM